MRDTFAPYPKNPIVGEAPAAKPFICRSVNYLSLASPGLSGAPPTLNRLGTWNISQPFDLPKRMEHPSARGLAAKEAACNDLRLNFGSPLIRALATVSEFIGESERAELSVEPGTGIGGALASKSCRARIALPLWLPFRCGGELRASAAAPPPLEPVAFR